MTADMDLCTAAAESDLDTLQRFVEDGGEGKGEQAKATVLFVDGGQKVLLLRFLEIQPSGVAVVEAKPQGRIRISAR